MQRLLFLVGMLLSPLCFAIVNGTPASTKTYPWMGDYGCGATLIAPQWALTVAHCFNTEDNKSVNIKNNNPRVTFLSDNVVNFSYTAQPIRTSEIIVHPGYNPAKGYNNDLALLKLDTPVSGVSPVTLMGDYDVPTNSAIITMGWGATGVNADGKAINQSPILLKAQLALFNQTQCQQLYSKVGGEITDNMICLSPLPKPNHADVCNGDSGGPTLITINNTIVQFGLVSDGLPHAPSCSTNSQTPAFYTRIANYQNWIKAYVPEAKFYNAPAACEPQLSGNLNIQIACLLYQNKVYKTNLQYTESSKWQWSKVLQTSNCPAKTSICAALDSNLALHLPHLKIGSSYYRAQLNWMPSEDVSVWTYHSHVRK